jgi:2-aminoethylphosphonate-pyruvate transaminase
MCCFGAIDIDIKQSNIDFLISSANKCIQGVPGISFIICNKDKLYRCRDYCKTLSLDLLDQYEQYERNNLFRFTPPTHVILAFKQALIELDEEGGPRARYKRIQGNHAIIHEEMHKLGFEDFVPLNEQSKIINSFYYPQDKNFQFDKFHAVLLERGMVIYSKSLTQHKPTFRIGNIGDIHSADMYDLIEAIKACLKQLDVNIPVS